MPAVPTAPPENVRIGSTTPSSLLLSWDPPPADQQNGQIRYYVIHATELGGSGNSLPALQSNTTQLLITNLLPIYNPYVFSLAAYTVGLGPISLTLTVNLPEACKFTGISHILPENTLIFVKLEKCTLYMILTPVET